MSNTEQLLELLANLNYMPDCIEQLSIMMDMPIEDVYKAIDEIFELIKNYDNA